MRSYRQPAIPAGLWTQDTVRQALKSRDVAALVKHFRKYTGASQTAVGALVGLAQSDISAIERGLRQVQSLEVPTFAPRPVGSPAVRAVQVLARAQTDAARRRAEALHRLRAALVTFYPAATTAWPKVGLRHPQARAVLAAAPSPHAAARLSRARFAEVLRTAGRWRTVEDEDERLWLHFRRPALRTHPAVEEARAATVLGLLADLDHACARADDLARRAVQAFSAHPSYKTIASFPGIGDLLGSRLLGEIGDHPHRFADARALCAYAGVVPATRASGTAARISMRRTANSELRNAFYQAAFCSLTNSPGAHAFYRRHASGRSRITQPCATSAPAWPAACSTACSATCRGSNKTPSPPPRGRTRSARSGGTRCGRGGRRRPEALRPPPPPSAGGGPAGGQQREMPIAPRATEPLRGNGARTLSARLCSDVGPAAG